MTAWYFIFFFFQAEDGIRDLTVTGVQTCALPISSRPARDASEGRRLARERRLTEDDHRKASPRRQLRQLQRTDEQRRAAPERAQHAGALRGERRGDRPVARLLQAHAHEFGPALRLARACC